LVWRAGWDNWRPYATADRPGSSSVEATASCIECHKLFPTAEMIQHEGSWVCADCKPIVFQRIKERAPISHDMRYAGFWIRFVAYFIDLIILQIVNLPLRFTLGTADPNGHPGFFVGVVCVSVLIVVGYEIFFIGRFGATLGKMALRLRVVMPGGEGISYVRATGRYFAKILSGLILCIGYIMVAFDEEKRGLHDRICNTRVIRLSA